MQSMRQGKIPVAFVDEVFPVLGGYVSEVVFVVGDLSAAVTVNAQFGDAESMKPKGISLLLFHLLLLLPTIVIGLWW